MKAKILILCAALLLLFSFGRSQPTNNAVKDVTMAAPNAASLGKYGDIPVSYFTGVPNVSIPVFSLQEGPLSVPISLNYHGSGIKVGEISSWVGLGWSLSAGGMISRTTMGIPDDVAEGYMNKGYLLMNPALGAATLEREKVADGARDSEPDIFNFSFAGYNGKFVIDVNNNIHILPKSDLKISYTRKTNGSGTLIRFIIITPDGTRYIFGGLETESENTESAVEYTTYDNNAVGAIAPTSWYLRRIESADQNYFITLDYVTEKYAYKNMGTCSVTWNYHQNQAGGSSQYCGPTSYGTNTSIVNHYVSGKRLSQITNSSNTQKIVFVANTDRQDLDIYSGFKGKQLDRIELYTPITTTCPHRFEFTYDYMISPGGTASEYKRLRLLSALETTCGIANPPYKFTYYPGTLPYRIYKGIDHWGYFNGVTTNEGKLNIPNISVAWLGQIISPGFATANRESSESPMLIGTLKRITYPTGGYNEFTFEANEVKKAATSVTNNYSYSLSNCTYPSSTCCTSTQPSSSKTFTSSELSGAKFNLKLYNLNINPYQYCNIGNSNPPIPSVQVIVKQTGQVSGIGSWSFNITNAQSFQEFTKPLTDLANLQPGVSYTFTLYVFNGKADFQIFNQSSSITYVPRKVGGLRIKQIKAHDGLSSTRDVIKNYKYTENDASNSPSSGNLYFEPKYYGYQQGYVIGEIGLIFQSTSITPMGSYNGYHIGYNRVIEETNGGGKTEYFFGNTEFYSLVSTDSYPYAPIQFMARDGNLSMKKIYAQNGATFSQIAEEKETAYADSYTYIPGLIYKAYKHPVPDVVYPNQFTVYFKIYQIRTSPYRIAQKEETIDGVKKTTTFEYDPTNQHLAAKAINFTNSDGAIHRTENKYVFDLPIGELRTALINKNIIGTPIETIQKVGSTKVSGSWMEYAFFGKSTGTMQINGSNAHPYPFRFYQHVITFNSSGGVLAQGWVLDGSIDSYHPTTSTGKGLPKQYTKVGWSPEYYEWANGLIKKRTFGAYNWEYFYLAGTSLVSSIKDIDGQITHFEYDNLMRLKKTSARNNNINTYYTYQYKDAASAYNYVNTRTTYTATTNSALTERETRQYLDGLGRVIQTVDKQYSPNQKDVVKAVEYDNQGRPFKVFEPFETANTTAAYATVPTTTKFTLTQYENSPLTRTIAVTPPSWYATTTAYGANTANEVPTTPNGTTYYPINSLIKTTVADPMGNKTISYVDKIGRLIATKKTNAAGDPLTALTTYNVYDVKSRLVKVVPPGSTATSTTLNYEYTYDGKNNMLTKKVPDQNLMSYKYNSRDLLTFVQDGNLQTANQWINTQYDTYGRVTRTGVYTNNNSFNGDIVPTTLTTILTENIYGTTGIELGKLKTSKSKILGTTLDLSTTYAYDAYGRIGSINGNNHLNLTLGSETHAFAYDFADNIMTDTRVHKPSSTQTYNIAERWTYDHVGRAKDYFHKLNGVETHIANTNYSIKDQIAERNIGKVTSPVATWLQSIDYAYNDMGWLTMINSNALTGTDMNLSFQTICNPVLPQPGPYNAQANPDPNDLFYMEFRYDVPFSSTSGAISGMPSANIQKSGNIAQMAWRVKGRDRQSYNFTYDYLNRLTSATYYDVNSTNTASATNRFNETLTYDVRGNILSLNRTGFYQNGTVCGYGTIDQLSYNITPSTNKLATVTDAAPTTNNQRTQGFNPGTGGTGYTYDSNGNLATDSYKGITKILYNHLNLPTSIKWDTGKKVDLQYDASGVQLSRTVYTGGHVTYRQDYVAGVEYRTVGGVRKLESIAHAEGRRYNTNVNTASTTEALRIEYAIRDHLGNTRITFTDKNNNGVVDVTNTSSNEILSENHYYAFGMTFGGNVWMNDATDIDHRYQYNGKELNNDHGLGWYNYGARFYDAVLGRFTGVDPLASEMPKWSPFSYTFDNPVRFIDPDGREPIPPDEFVQLEDGTYERIGSIGGNEFDIIYQGEIQDDGAVIIHPNDTRVVEIETSYTSGPGNNYPSAQKDNPTSGFREVHNRPPTEFWAITSLFTGGSNNAALAITNKNNNNAIGNFVTYVFKLFGKTHKVGKADSGRVTQSTGLPTRIHQQRRELVKKHGEQNVSVHISRLGKTTTKEAKRVEKRILKKMFERTGKIPEGNKKSFKPEE